MKISDQRYFFNIPEEMPVLKGYRLKGEKNEFLRAVCEATGAEFYVTAWPDRHELVPIGGGDPVVVKKGEANG